MEAPENKEAQTGDRTPGREAIERVYALAYEYEQKYGSCPQCVLGAIQDVFGSVDDATFKASQVLAGGGALCTTGTCGALVGGMLALGSKYGRERQSFGAGSNNKAYKLGKRLYDKFVAEFGSPVCADVQVRLFGRSFDLWGAREYKAFEDAGGHRDKCPSVAGKTAMWTAQVLMEEEERQKG